VSPGAQRGPVSLSEYVVLEKRNVESPIKRRMYMPIVANVVRVLRYRLGAGDALSTNCICSCPVADNFFATSGLLVCMHGQPARMEYAE
jgi:hypothetical protein